MNYIEHNFLFRQIDGALRAEIDYFNETQKRLAIMNREPIYLIAVIYGTDIRVMECVTK